MKQTAVEWYSEQAMKLELERAKGNISIIEMLNQLRDVRKQAIKMEIDQIFDAYLNKHEKPYSLEMILKAQQYYNNKFKSE